MMTSVFLLANISVRSPQKLFTFTIQSYVYRIKDSRLKLFNFALTKSLLMTSVAVLAEIPLRSPQKILSKKHICWVKVSKNKII